MEQQQLFTETPGTVLLELAVDGITELSEFEKRRFAASLAKLVRYHAEKLEKSNG